MSQRVPTAPSLTILAVVLLLTAGCAPGEPPPSEATDARLAIQNVTVVDVIDGSLRPAQTVVIEGSRISQIGPVADVDVEPAARVVDGGGRYLIPGLWDMHVHMASDVSELVPWDVHTPASGDPDQREIYLPVYLAFGVTGVREMSGGEGSLQMREHIERGELLGPHTVVGSPLLDGPESVYLGDGSVIRIDGPAHAREVVTELHAQGFDFLKPYSFLPAEAYRALQQRARELGMDVAGELPWGISAWEAAELGQRSIEHLVGVELACSRREDELRERYVARIGALNPESSFADRRNTFIRNARESVEDLDPARCDELFAHLADHDTWVVPTLVHQLRLSYPGDPRVADDPNVRYLHPDERDPQTVADEAGPDRPIRPVYDYRISEIPRLHRAGVGILAGSDLPAGFYLHHELDIFAESGLSPLDALRTATINPARYLGREEELGSIEVGKIADLVLLGANPLEDIGNTRSIQAVVFQGHLLDREHLDRMLEELAVDADNWPE